MWYNPKWVMIIRGKSVVGARVGGANTTPLLAVYFAKRNTKDCGDEKARAGREFIFPTPLFLPAPPERNF